MGKIVFMFAGQGAQSPGMGRELYDNSTAARSVFDMAEGVRPGTLDMCFNGTDAELSKTINTQPCLYCTDLAAAAALTEAGAAPDMLAGFSLGELAALAYSGAVTYEDGFKMACARAEAMQTASERVDAVMAAVLKLPDDTVIELCSGLSDVYPVNFNCDGQVVVSGLRGSMEALYALVKEAGGRSMPLKTGGGFHSPFMAPAKTGFAEALKSFNIKDPAIPLYSNVTGERYGGGGDVRELLCAQISSPVLWRAEVENLLRDGADTFVELGPGKVLSGLVRRISGAARVWGVEDLLSLEAAVKGVRE